MKIAPFIIGFIIVCLVSYGAWKLQRWWHWNWGYEANVVETVCDMVKPEYLTDPSKCK